MSFKNCKLVGWDVNPVDYHKNCGERGEKCFVMSSSALREFNRCPSRWRAGFVSKNSDAKEYGSILDCLALTPHQFNSRYVIQPETYDSKDGKKPWHNGASACKTWNADVLASGKEIISASDFDEANRAIIRMFSDQTIQDWTDASDKQVYISGEWHDETGIVVPVKCLIDYVPFKDSKWMNCIGDLKTCRTAALTPWSRHCFEFGYFVQAGFNIDLYAAATGEARDTFCFILQENYHPWQTGKRMLSQRFLDLGRCEYKRMLSRYCQCLKWSRWPDYDSTDESSTDGWSLVEPEPWMESKAMFEPQMKIADEDTEQPESEDFSDDVTP